MFVYVDVFEFRNDIGSKDFSVCMDEEEIVKYSVDWQWKMEENL